MEPVHNSLREYLPAEMRLLPGVVGLVGGGAFVVLFFYTIFVVHYPYHWRSPRRILWRDW